MPPNDTPYVTAKVRAMDRDHSVSDRHRYEQMMIAAARFERALRKIHTRLYQHYGIDASGPEVECYEIARDALNF